MDVLQFSVKIMEQIKSESSKNSYSKLFETFVELVALPLVFRCFNYYTILKMKSVTWNNQYGTVNAIEETTTFAKIYDDYNFKQILCK